MKAAGDWTEKDLETLIRDGREEDVRLALYPRQALGKDPADREALSREVSAMANADGGLLVFGIETRAGKPVRLDPIDAAALTQGWLEGQLESAVQPPIRDLKAQAVPLAHKPDRCVYLVEVPRSDDAPHQAADRRFYKRSNNQAVAMEAYEVRDCLARARRPDVRPRCELVARREVSLRGRVAKKLIVTVANVGAVPAHDIYAEIRVPAPLVSAMSRFSEDATEENAGAAWRVFRRRLNGGPLYPGAETAVTDERANTIALEWTPESAPAGAQLRCDVYADGGVRRTAVLELPK